MFVDENFPNDNRFRLYLVLKLYWFRNHRR
ncbi:MAG: hypothetical protein RLZ22_1004, partial [Verrucomicrobiota bacterium]